MAFESLQWDVSHTEESGLIIFLWEFPKNNGIHNEFQLELK